MSQTSARRKIIRVDLTNLPKGRKSLSASNIDEKNAGPTGGVLMMDANEKEDVLQAIEYVRMLAEIRTWFIEEPTAPNGYVLHVSLQFSLHSVFHSCLPHK